MSKIVSSGSDPILPLDVSPAIQAKVEVIVTPEPKTRKQRQANAKATRLNRAQERQDVNAYRAHKQSESQRTARRKRKRDVYYRTVQADLAAGRITDRQTKERLTKRRKSARSDT